MKTNHNKLKYVRCNQNSRGEKLIALTAYIGNEERSDTNNRILTQENRKQRAKETKGGIMEETIKNRNQ